VSLTKIDEDGQQRAELKKSFQKFVKLKMRKVCAKMVPKDLLTQHCL
jgi:hypothetical protein